MPNVTMNKLKYLSLIFVIVLSSYNSNTKSRTVFLDKELKEAMYIDYVEIVNYSDSSIQFKEIVGFKGYHSMKWFNTQNFERKTENPSAILSAKLLDGIDSDFGFKKHTTGYFPRKGEKVLIVITENNHVSLFAAAKNDQFRFWSPFFTESMALFYFKTPASKLKGENTISNKFGDYETCWDGCLLPKNKLLTYGHFNNYQEFTGTPKSRDGTPIFSGDYSYSEPYFLNNAKEWEQRYLNKEVTVKGILIQFVEGKSMILDWEIIRVE